jgi:hypothetical protein
MLYKTAVSLKVIKQRTQRIPGTMVIVNDSGDVDRFGVRTTAAGTRETRETRESQRCSRSRVPLCLSLLFWTASAGTLFSDEVVQRCLFLLRNRKLAKELNSLKMTSVSSAELISLLRLLNLDETMGAIQESFNRTFLKSEHFRVGCSLCTLLQDKMLTKCQVCYNDGGHRVYSGLSKDIQFWLLSPCHLLESCWLFFIVRSIPFRSLGNKSISSLLSG